MTDGQERWEGWRRNSTQHNTQAFKRQEDGKPEWDIDKLTEKMEARTAEDLRWRGSAFHGPVLPARRRP